MKEGMTMPSAASLIDILGTYYSTTKRNKENDTKNDVNEDNTLQAIQNLKLTDTKYTTILNSSELNASSKINMVNKTLRDSITKNDKYSMNMDQFRQILNVMNDKELGNDPAQQKGEIKNITYNTLRDDRFKSFFDTTVKFKDDNDFISQLKSAILDIINS